MKENCAQPENKETSSTALEEKDDILFIFAVSS
jgi:hypothetical protein